MIKFFRKIRYDLMETGKTGKYFKYAIGEIVLVVIGILIALSINTWNQNRLVQIEKKEMLSKLQIEFQANKKILQDFKMKNDRTMNFNIEVINLIGKSKEVLSKHNLDSLLFHSFQGYELGFSDNAIKNIVQSDGLNLFKDEEITTLLNQWNALSDIRDTRLKKIDNWNSNHFIPFLLPYISFKEMDSNGNFRWTGKSKVKPDYYILFQKVEFENLIDNALWYYKSLQNRLEETEVLIDEIISATKSES